MLMSSRGRPAKIFYMPGTYRVLSAGDHVVCAVTQQLIPLGELKYWSADRQEAYASVEAVMKAEGRE
jgi:hypothetical protein